MKEQLVLELKELRFLELTCPEEDCAARVTLDMESATQGLVDKCPACGTALSTVGGSFAVMLGKYKDFYRTLADSKAHIVFRVTRD